MSGIRSITRNPTVKGFASANSAPFYVDSDDNKTKLIPAGSGTTEVSLVDTSASFTLAGKTALYTTVTTYLGATDAIDISLGDIFMLARVGAADAATLADPVAADNGRMIKIFSGSAQAHTITVASGIGGAGATDDVITFTNRISASITLFAHNTKWYVIGSYLAAIA